MTSESDKKYRGRYWLYQKYVNEGLSMEKIGKKCGVHAKTIFRWLKELDIPRRSVGYLKGKDHPNWKGGKRKCSSGHIIIHRPDHPQSSKQGYVLEHRLVMEKRIGRYLYPWETVHHINGVKDDNRNKNLRLLPREEHNTKIQEVHQENQWLKEQLANFLSIGA